MKSLEECLDETLKALKESWERSEREPINVIELLQRIELPEYHEFYKSLIRRLVADGFAEYKAGEKPPSNEDLEFYKNKILITVDGYYHLQNGGYKQRKIDKQNQRLNKIAKDVLHDIYYLIATIGIIAALRGCNGNNEQEDDYYDNECDYHSEMVSP